MTNEMSRSVEEVVTSLVAGRAAKIPLSGGLTELLHKSRRLGFRFFGRPDDVKRRCVAPYQLGYRPAGVEYSQSPLRPDPFESFSASFRTRADGFQLPDRTAILLHAALLRLEDALAVIVSELLVCVARRFGASRQEELGWRLWSTLQINFSRPANVTSPYIHEEHEDGHMVTLGWADAPGLEVRTSGHMRSVDPPSSALIVMPGEILTLLTGGAIRPLFHRVRALRTLATRVAVLYFVDPEPTACRPWRVTDSNLHVDIGAKVLTNAHHYGVEPFDFDMRT